MKRANFKELAIILLSLSLVFIFGCSENSSINEPNDQIATSVEQNSDMDPLSLSKKKHHKSPNGYTVTKTIDGKKGGSISLKVSMDESTGTKSEVKLKFPKKSFEGKQEFTITLVPGSPVVEFSPAFVFEKELKLDVKLENFWFGEEDELDFGYLNELGVIVEEVEYESLRFNYNKNYVKVKKAKIKHFSRYGFTR